MKKKMLSAIALMFIMMFSSLQGFAQETQVKEETENKNASWFVSAGGGLSYIGAEMSSVKTAIRFGGEFSVGKWFHPYFGTRLQLAGGQLRKYSYVDWQGGSYIHKDGSLHPYPMTPVKDLKTTSDGKYYQNDFSYMSASVDFMFNLMGLIKHDTGEQKFNLIPFVGVGWMHAFEGDMNPDSNSISGKLGLRVNYAFNPNWGIYLEPQFNFMNEKFDGYTGGSTKFDMVNNLFLGVEYRF